MRRSGVLGKSDATAEVRRSGVRGKSDSKDVFIRRGVCVYLVSVEVAIRRGVLAKSIVGLPLPRRRWVLGRSVGSGSTQGSSSWRQHKWNVGEHFVMSSSVIGCLN